MLVEQCSTLEQKPKSRIDHTTMLAATADKSQIEQLYFIPCS